MLEHCIFHHRQAHLQSSRPHLLATVVSDMTITFNLNQRTLRKRRTIIFDISFKEPVDRKNCVQPKTLKFLYRTSNDDNRKTISFIFFLRAHNFQVVREENLTDFSWRDAFPSEGEINHKWCIHLLLVMKLFPRHVILRSLFLDKRYKNRPKKAIQLNI